MEKARASSLARAGIFLLVLIGSVVSVKMGSCQAGDITVNFASDPTWQVFAMSPDGSVGPLLGSAQCVCAIPGWFCGLPSAEIPGACSVWMPGVTPESPADLQGAYFTKTFDLAGTPVAGNIGVAVDDFAEVRVNGTIVGSTGSISNLAAAAAAQGSLVTFNLTPFLLSGTNTISIRAQNGPAWFTGGQCDPCTYATNVAEVVFGGTLSYSTTGPVAQVFHDDFDGSSLNPDSWLVAGGGTITVAAGSATLSAGCGETFPYITSKFNPFPATGDFLVRIGFRYQSPQAGGNGFGATDTWNNPYPLRAFGVWQDFCCGGFRAYCGDGVSVFLGNAPETSYHVFEWRYLSGTYFLFVDGVARGSGESTFRPTGIFFGHPPITYCPWTTQEIDFVHVEALGITAAAPMTWGRLKSLYR